jgi:hypothetical protein
MEQPFRLAYQPPASITFLSEQTSHQPAVLFSHNKSALAISHQPNEQASGMGNIIATNVPSSNFTSWHKDYQFILVLS